MFRGVSSWWYSSPASQPTMSRNVSDQALDESRFEARESRREMSGDDASGGKDMALDNQGSSQSGKHEPKLRRTESSMVITKPQTSHTRGRHAPGPLNAKDSELVVSIQKGTGHLSQDRKYSEVVRDRAQKEEVQNTKDTKLLAAQAEADGLREKLKTSERQMDWLSKTLEDERREKRELKNTKAPELDLAKKEAHALRQKLEKAEKENRRYAVHYERQEQELHTVREQLQRVEIGHEQSRVQLMERTAELQSAELFINVADSLSGADIINMTTALNAEILQSAALMADSLDYTERQGEVSKEVLVDVQRRIGENLTRALMDQRYGKDIDPTLVQLALQVCLVRCSETIITSWTLGGNDDRLSNIYWKIWNEEKQSVAGRWRSMTQMHAAAANGPHLALQMVVRAVKGVLIVTRTNYHPFFDQFQEWLSTINTLSLHLRSSIGQQITSMEIHPFTIESGTAFNPNEMDDTYAEERRSNSMAVETSGRVAGSTELGLISRVKAINGKVETQIMLKPKVVLCSALTEDG